MAILKSLKDYLNKHLIAYEIIHHRRDFTAQETAADTHTKGADFAKTVILWVDAGFCMGVLPATHSVDFQKIKDILNAREVKLATEDEIKTLCADCEVGAMPPIGSFYKLPVYISHYLTHDHTITFNAGTHEDVIRMSYRDYDDLVKPKVMDLTVGDPTDATMTA